MGQVPIQKRFIRARLSRFYCYGSDLCAASAIYLWIGTITSLFHKYFGSSGGFYTSQAITLLVLASLFLSQAKFETDFGSRRGWAEQLYLQYNFGPLPRIRTLVWKRASARKFVASMRALLGIFPLIRLRGRNPAGEMFFSWEDCRVTRAQSCRAFLLELI